MEGEEEELNEVVGINSEQEPGQMFDGLSSNNSDMNS